LSCRLRHHGYQGSNPLCDINGENTQSGAKSGGTAKSLAGQLPASYRSLQNITRRAGHKALRNAPGRAPHT
jgi:hypothetical protein